MNGFGLQIKPNIDTNTHFLSLSVFYSQLMMACGCGRMSSNSFVHSADKLLNQLITETPLRTYTQAHTLSEVNSLLVSAMPGDGIREDERNRKCYSPEPEAARACI